VGEINVKGFSLGVGAVLFVALAMGWFAPKSVPSAMVGTLGLALVLYGVGMQYGTQFFIGLTSRGGLRANMIALTGVLAAGAVSLAFMKMMDLKLGHALGLFAGSGTSTATLQAAVATLGNNDPAVGYSVAYPFGVAGPILFLYIAFTLLKPKIQVPTGTGLELLEIAVRNPELSGKSLGELMTALPGGVQIVALRREGRNEPASPNFVIAENDVLLATAPSKEALAQAGTILGEAAHGYLVTDRRDLDYLRVFASRPTVVAEHWAISTCRGRRRPSSSRSAAEIPTSCRARISCWNSATASACSPIAAISRRCANTSATRSRAPPSSATSPSASAWRSAS
jgi:putative transport protein